MIVYTLEWGLLYGCADGMRIFEHYEDARHEAMEKLGEDFMTQKENIDFDAWYNDDMWTSIKEMSIE